MAANSGAAAVLAAAKKLPLARLAKWTTVVVLAVWVVPVLVLLGVRAVSAATDPWGLIVDGLVPFIANAWLLILAMVVPVAAGLVWSRLHPVSWAPVKSRLFGSIRGVLVYRFRWARLCRACGLTKKNKNNGDDEPARLARVRLSPAGDDLHVRLLPGMIPDDFTRRADDLAHALGAREVGVTSPKPGWVRLTVNRRDVLARPFTLDAVPPILNPAKVPYAIGEDGLWRHRSYVNVSGEVGGGLPGSGKTAGETSLACGLAQNPAVQFVVIDGKGGDDWSWIEPRASIYINDDEDFTVVRDALHLVESVARHRVRTQRRARGNSNFWNLPLVPEHPWLVVIVDEVQTWTETRAIVNKDDKALGEQITAQLARLVKKYRSAGVVTRVLTQKPTGDTLPTQIRDNTAIRTAWRVTSRAAAASIHGDEVINEATISPTGIGEGQPGVAVVGDGKGNLQRVRFPYVTEETAERIAQASAHLRHDMTTTGFAPVNDDVELERVTVDGHSLPPAPPGTDATAITSNDGHDEHRRAA